MIRKLTILGVLFSLLACASASRGATPAEIELQNFIEAAKRELAEQTPVVTPTPATLTPARNSSSVKGLSESTPPLSVKSLDAATLSADAQPTPMAGVAAGLAALNLKPTDVLIDYGCGHDARWLITAVRLYGLKRAIGIEIDPAAADSARRYVEHAGLSDVIDIHEGDATKVSDIHDANVGCAYLWPDTLAKLKTRIERLDRFVSYDYAVPSLPMKPLRVAGGGIVHAWNRPPATVQVPITQTVRTGGITMLPRGSYCEVCKGHCNRPMAHAQKQVITGYKTVPAPTYTQQAAPAARPGFHLETRTRQECQFDRRGRRTGCRTVEYQAWVRD